MSPRTLGLLLAGGEGRRMGGVDKGWVTYQGRPLVEWVLEALRPQVDAVWISANRNQERYAALGSEVLSDDAPTGTPFGGPLAGVHAAFQRLRPRPGAFDWVWLAPCDAPHVPGDLAAALHRAAGAAPAVLPRTPDGRLQPVHALLSTRLPVPPAHGSLVAWLLAQGAAVLEWPTPLTGFNTPEALSGACE